jgi:hypothetical protein
MIAFKDGLPLIQLHNGHSVNFDRAWLMRSLNNAAAKAGYQKWWLAEHVAQSVTEYLRAQREKNVLPVAELNSAVRSVLEVIGYPEVGQHFVSARPRVQLSLVELARDAGAGYELAFFDLLQRHIRRLVCEEGCDFELWGLDRCVKLLKARKVWARDCEELQEHIIEFARQQAELLADGADIAFALS